MIIYAYGGAIFIEINNHVKPNDAHQQAREDAVSGGAGAEMMASVIENGHHAAWPSQGHAPAPRDTLR